MYTNTLFYVKKSGLYRKSSCTEFSMSAYWTQQYIICTEIKKNIFLFNVGIIDMLVV